MFTAFREQAAVAMSELSLDMGLIHADLVRENVLVNGSDLYFIDFDDGGFGYRLFDVATALLKNRAEPNYADLQTALIDGYRSLRALDTTQLDLFLALARRDLCRVDRATSRRRRGQRSQHNFDTGCCRSMCCVACQGKN